LRAGPGYYAVLYLSLILFVSSSADEHQLDGFLGAKPFYPLFPVEHRAL